MSSHTREHNQKMHPILTSYLNAASGFFVTSPAKLHSLASQVSLEVFLHLEAAYKRLTYK
jgi:hypothetical protein